ncbi:MAG: hypothetical protein HYU52_08940 [Acidobacteria bacterium]|nr:hypothetical protein [Acidobacteriota bacterium]
MRTIGIAFLVLVVMISPAAGAKEVYIPISGSVGVFRTDVRVFNPSYTDAITVQAYMHPTGNVDNTGVAPVSFDVPARQMKIFDDVLLSLFNATGLAGIRLTSESDFAATARIYAQASNGTLGQFEVGVEATDALLKGAILQLKSNAAFRTNAGFQNTSDEIATVALTLYGKDNQVVKESTLTIQPRGVVAPTEVVGLMGGGITADLSDCWLSFDSNRALAAYGSVVDNGTTDPTFIPAVSDSGVKPPAQTTKEFDIRAQQFHYTVTPVGGSPTTGAFTVNKGDKVVLRIMAADTTHGFSMFPYVSSRTLNPGQTVTVTFDAIESGNFTFFCTIVCGSGHGGMSGTMTVNP